jgi:hypothetical protein
MELFDPARPFQTKNLLQKLLELSTRPDLIRKLVPAHAEEELKGTLIGLSLQSL